MNKETVKPYAEQLKALRLEMGYSLGDMARLMGCPKATYQGYETGRRAMPAGFINRAREWQQIGLDFMAGVAGRVDEQLRLDGFGKGIPSAREAGQ